MTESVFYRYTVMEETWQGKQELESGACYMSVQCKLFLCAGEWPIEVVLPVCRCYCWDF